MLLTDAKGRTWTVTDLSGMGEFGQVVPLGSARASYRTFECHGARRIYALKSDDERRDASREMLYRQLRASWDPDYKEPSNVAAKIQDLYAGRRMGKR